MGIFGNNRAKRLQQLDQLTRSASEGLAREMVNGELIQLLNLYKRIQRFSPNMMDEDMAVYYLTDAAEESVVVLLRLRDSVEPPAERSVIANLAFEIIYGYLCQLAPNYPRDPVGALLGMRNTPNLSLLINFVSAMTY